MNSFVQTKNFWLWRFWRSLSLLKLFVGFIFSSFRLKTFIMGAFLMGLSSSVYAQPKDGEPYHTINQNCSLAVQESLKNWAQRCRTAPGKNCYNAALELTTACSDTPAIKNVARNFLALGCKKMDQLSCHLLAKNYLPQSPTASPGDKCIYLENYCAQGNKYNHSKFAKTCELASNRCSNGVLRKNSNKKSTEQTKQENELAQVEPNKSRKNNNLELYNKQKFACNPSNAPEITENMAKCEAGNSTYCYELGHYVFDVKKCTTYDNSNILDLAMKTLNLGCTQGSNKSCQLLAEQSKLLDKPDAASIYNDVSTLKRQREACLSLRYYCQNKNKTDRENGFCRAVERCESLASDREATLALYLDLCEKGNIEACLDYGYMHETGDFDINLKDSSNQDKNVWSIPNYGKAAKAYKIACYTYDSKKSCEKLAQLFKNPHGLYQNPTEAKKHEEKARSCKHP